MDEHGAEGRQTADEPPVIVPDPRCPDMRVKKVYVTEMLSADNTTYSMGESPGQLGGGTVKTAAILWL